MPIGIVIAVIIASVVVSILVFNLANIKASIRVEHKTASASAGKSLKVDEAFKSTVLQEMSKIPGSRHNMEEAAKVLSDVFTKEVDTRVSAVSQEISQKYESVIDEKNKQVEIVTEKYRSVSDRYKKISAEKRQTEAVVRSMAEGLIVVDDKGKVLLMNPAAEELLGSNKKDKLGKPLTQDLKKEQLVSMVTGSGSGEEKEIVLKSTDEDSKKVLRSSSAVIENQDGKTVGMVSVLTDVTKQKELDEMKSKFVSNVSHELRTPLVAIQKSISVILSKAAGPLTEPQEKFLTIADRNLERLSRLIDDVLDTAKIEAGKMKLELKAANVGKVISDACDTLESWAKSKSIALVKRIQDGMPEVNIDADRITQILSNLVGNAIKFTPQNGTITVEVKYLSEADKIEVSVADTGVGIPQKDLAKIFNRFEQSSERVATDISGTGLGLSIAKEIVALHGGDIWVESEKNKGAKFTFILPLTRS